jgi:hypothetical protein
LKDVEERDNRVRREIDVTQSIAGVVQNRAELQLSEFQVRKDAFALREG